MNLLFKLPKHPFNYTFLINLLSNYKFPRDKISYMLKKKDIIRIKKGLYVLSPQYNNEIDLKVISNLVYGPSYISLDYALSYWGIIPEHVGTITSVTNKRNKSIKTPLGYFTYKYINNKVFPLGIEHIESEQGNYFIGSKEKSICDKFASLKIKGKKEIRKIIFDDLRFDKTEISNLNKDGLKKIKEHYHKKSVSFFVDWYLNNF